jgi:CRP-like cAMP-binding protein
MKNAGGSQLLQRFLTKCEAEIDDLLRLASLLLDSFYEQEGATMERDLTLSEIATMVASSPEVICRVLHNFQAEGILDVTRAHITLHDRDALSRLVDVV